MIVVRNINIKKYGKQKKYKYDDRISWVNANAENLPFEDNTFDAYLVSFGARNFSDINQSLHEARRVLKNNGRLLCLEFSKVQNVILNLSNSINCHFINFWNWIITGNYTGSCNFTKISKITKSFKNCICNIVYFIFDLRQAGGGRAAFDMFVVIFLRVFEALGLRCLCRSPQALLFPICLRFLIFGDLDKCLCFIKNSFK